jgi:hypothetical protein
MKSIILILGLIFSLNVLIANPPDRLPKKPDTEHCGKCDKNSKHKKSHKKPYKPMPKKVLSPN